MNKSERARAVETARTWADEVEDGVVLGSNDGAALAGHLRSLAHTLDAYGAQLEDDSKWEQDLFEIAQELGFTGVGLGRRHAVLQVFEWAARNRTNPKSHDSEATS